MLPAVYAAPVSEWRQGWLILGRRSQVDGTEESARETAVQHICVTRVVAYVGMLSGTSLVRTSICKANAKKKKKKPKKNQGP